MLHTKRSEALQKLLHKQQDTHVPLGKWAMCVSTLHICSVDTRSVSFLHIDLVSTHSVVHKINFENLKDGFFKKFKRFETVLKCTDYNITLHLSFQVTLLGASSATTVTTSGSNVS